MMYLNADVKNWHSGAWVYNLKKCPNIKLVYAYHEKYDRYIIYLLVMFLFFF